MYRQLYKGLAIPGIILLLTFFSHRSIGQEILSANDMSFLEQMTRDVLERSRIAPNEKITDEFGPNGTGITLIRPGGRSSYPAYWIRDYAMSIASGMVTRKEQHDLLLLTAANQCDQTFITRQGSMIPQGAIPDHIRIDDGKPIYFPGSYSYEGQGGKKWGYFPPYCDQFYFIDMVYLYLKHYGSGDFLKKEVKGVRLIDRLELAFRVAPNSADGALVTTTENFRGVDFGFRDVITMTGDLCFPSLLKYKAAMEMAELMQKIHRSDKAKFYKNLAQLIKETIPERFADTRGMLHASTGQSCQGDVWSTAYAVYLGVLEGAAMQKASTLLRDAYRQGTLAHKGNIRHILTTDDFSSTTAWEQSHVSKNNYQNGAWWGTPTGWVCSAIARIDQEAARQLAKEYIDDLREGDFRKGDQYGAPWECYNLNGPQNGLYLATVSCPLIVFREMILINRKMNHQDMFFGFSF